MLQTVIDFSLRKYGKLGTPYMDSQKLGYRKNSDSLRVQIYMFHMFSRLNIYIYNINYS